MDQDLNFDLPQVNSKNPSAFNGNRGEKISSLSALSFKDYKREEFVFDSNFESGNLDFVGKVSDTEYDLLMRLDSNSRSHQQWFYFSIDCKDIKKRSIKGESIKVNILNFTKPNSLYNQVWGTLVLSKLIVQGMRPVAWSKQKCMKEGIGWHRVGQNIVYKVSKLCKNISGQTASSQQYESIMTLIISDFYFRRTWFQMTFDYTFEYDDDKIWFAYALPYTFTMLSNFLKAIEEI